ncbi:hypothetical protein O181_037221 [Austropuccinia psidii MF-1]|uniref:Uncharacterized protein n=1 Tax=Austropuccinia psidii MF-1 TaxID=1389203 RepID=A0A9Q3D5S1_9BASI|nr:hypothetical protein [Austropuccinia psidii MF-1]
MQSIEGPFACLATPASVIIIDNMPIGSPPSISPEITTASSPLVPSPPHSHNEAWKKFTDFQPTLMTPRAIVHKSIQ